MSGEDKKWRLNRKRRKKKINKNGYTSSIGKAEDNRVGGQKTKRSSNGGRKTKRSSNGDKKIKGNSNDGGKKTVIFVIIRVFVIAGFLIIVSFFGL